MDGANNNTKPHLGHEPKLNHVSNVPDPIHVLTCSASLGSGWCICSGLLPAASCAPAAVAANSCCSPAQLPDCLPLQPSLPGSRSRGCETRAAHRASSMMSSRGGPRRKSLFCWSRDADCRASCPSWRRDGTQQEEEQEERGGGKGMDQKQQQKRFLAKHKC